MFGSSKNNEDAPASPSSPSKPSPKPPNLTVPDGVVEDEPKSGVPESPSAERVDSRDTPEKRSRRSSGMSKAKEMFSSAKNSLVSGSPTRTNSDKQPQTPIQKLGRTDPALSVPQGSYNNAAGESNPGPRSTFRVGVTEDKNKKCRRTMEDTHAYLYNFLSTPAPQLGNDDHSRQRSSTADSRSSVVSHHPVVETDNGYFAIFDGHAGTFAAEWCGKKLHILLEETIRRSPNKAIPELLDETFTSVDTQLEKLPLKNSGCTAVIAVLRWEDRIPNNNSATGSSSIAPVAEAAVKKESESKDEQTPVADLAPAIAKQIRDSSSRQRVLYTANVGDARIILCRNGKALRLSYDHKGSDDNEGKRIANAGGLILNNRVNGVLAVTRALGDAYMKDLVTGHPYTTETVIQSDIDEFLILACDGLWDVCTDQEAVDLVRHEKDPQVASKILVDHALSRFSTDNLSCMIVRLNNAGLQNAAAKSTEHIGVDGDPPSTLKGGIRETEAIVGAAKKGMPVDPVSDESPELSRISTEMIQEEEAEPGPELDPEGLTKAREKAKEGQAVVATGDNPNTKEG
ncbi:MAG: hypothetical protein Q9162_006632 [Coniocarpon cinnabarinum]